MDEERKIEFIRDWKEDIENVWEHINLDDNSSNTIHIIISSLVGRLLGCQLVDRQMGVYVCVCMC